ncbi:hypothetical protein ACFFOU_27710 [Pseudonocardia sulfidoxydans]
MSRRTPHLARPAAGSIAAVTKLVRGARRVVLIGVRPVRVAGNGLCSFLDQCGAFYLDTGECRGVIRDNHPSFALAIRGRLMAEADLCFEESV